jgi:hypothetical protein
LAREKENAADMAAMFVDEVLAPFRAAIAQVPLIEFETPSFYTTQVTNICSTCFLRPLLFVECISNFARNYSEWDNRFFRTTKLNCIEDQVSSKAFLLTLWTYTQDIDHPAFLARAGEMASNIVPVVVKLCYRISVSRSICPGPVPSSILCLNDQVTAFLCDGLRGSPLVSSFSKPLRRAKSCNLPGDSV